ncbi:hypothetical protein C8Q76DRAFT_184168 [Earliella scabrosa]|nr:hypothetical protein C8Q76DRAFT_184168 [Earliella scabrosa]
MASPGQTIPKIALDDTLGAAFLGHVVTTFLYGITTLQAFMYYRNQYRDANILKFSVLLLWILDTAHCALITGAMYWYCITSFTNLPAVQTPIWPIPSMIIVSNVSNAIVRGIFGYRLYRLNNNGWILPLVIAVMSVFIFVDATYFAVKLFGITSYTHISRFSWGLYAGLSVEAAVDLIVAIAQCLLLRGFETGIRTTDSAIKVLMTYSVNTGLLTSLCAIGALISYATVPEKFIYFAFYFVLSKLYVNSLLATLNARGSLLGRKGRRRAQSKVAFRTPTVTAEPAATAGAAIEFTTVISADALSTDSIVETSKTRIDSDEEAAFPFRG